jgi:hypothetical protein
MKCLLVDRHQHEWIITQSSDSCTETWRCQEKETSKAGKHTAQELEPEYLTSIVSLATGQPCIFVQSKSRERQRKLREGGSWARIKQQRKTLSLGFSILVFFEQRNDHTIMEINILQRPQNWFPMESSTDLTSFVTRARIRDVGVTSSHLKEKEWMHYRQGKKDGRHTSTEHWEPSWWGLYVSPLMLSTVQIQSRCTRHQK